MWPQLTKHIIKIGQIWQNRKVFGGKVPTNTRGFHRLIRVVDLCLSLASQRTNGGKTCIDWIVA